MLMVQMCVMFNVSNGNKHADKFTVAHQQEEIVQELDHHTRTIGIRETSIIVSDETLGKASNVRC